MGRFVVLMCLGISANGEACFPCGCKTQQRHTTLATTVGFNPIQGTGADAGYWLTFETCFEALRVGTELSVGGMCGVDSSTNYCAGCIRTEQGGTEVIEAVHDEGCPPTTTTTTTTTTTITTLTTTTTTTTITTITTTTTTVTTTTNECHCLYDGDTLPEESWA